MGLDFTIQYRKGKENVVADALSRRDENAACQSIIAIVSGWMKELEESYEKAGWLREILAQLVVNPTVVLDYTLTNGLVRYKGRLVVGDDPTLKEKILKALHCSPAGGHSGIRVTYQKVNQLFFFLSRQKIEVLEFVMACAECHQCKHE